MKHFLSNSLPYTVSRYFALLLAGAFLSFALPSCASAPAGNTLSDNSAALRTDSAVRSGSLDNGMDWFVLPNGEPDNRISLRLVVKAGSMLEEDDQKGVAHFVEHLAFNGTEHFARNQLVDYFESIGMSFGPEVNAYTSFDETVYKLEVPADDPAALDRALLVLRDWACAIAFDEAELERERGVVIEEWRIGRGADGRVQDKLFPFLFEGSRYAERLPIGDPEIIRNVSRERVLDFYRTWYRADLMSVVVAGDAEADYLASRVRDVLSTVPAPDGKKSLPSFTSPGKTAANVMIVRDPELTYTTIQLFQSRKVHTVATRETLREDIIEEMSFSIFNARMSEKVLAADPVILGSMAQYSHLGRSNAFSFFGLVPANGRFTSAFTEYLAEILRFEKFGATDAEIAREKASLLEQVNQLWLEREKAQSSGRADRIIDQWLYDNVMLSFQDMYDLYGQIVPTITGAEILDAARNWLDGRGNRLAISAPASATEIPGEAELLALWQNWKPETELQPYTETNLERPLFPLGQSASPLSAGSIVSEKPVSSNGITELTLSNGVRVLIYPTDYKANEVVFAAISKGGMSLVDDAGYFSASVADDYADQSGLGGFNPAELGKKLAGKSVSQSLWIDDYWEGLHGSASTAEMETLFQLVNLRFTASYFTEEGWKSLYAQLQASVEGRETDPEEMFSDLVLRLRYGNNARYGNLDAEKLLKMQSAIAEKIYRERFANAADFLFVFAGSLDPVRVRDLCVRYLSVLPATPAREEPRDTGVPFPKGITRDTLAMGLDQKSQVYLSLGGATEIAGYDYETFNALIALLDIRLREVVREEMGGSYGVSVSGVLSVYPSPHYEIEISFGCEPGREADLLAAVIAQMEWFKASPTGETYLIKLRENYRRSMETGLRNNTFWVNMITGYLLKGRPLDAISDTARVNALYTGEVMQAAAKRFFTTENRIEASLVPEKKKGE